MAKYEVKFSCGHTEIVNLLGKKDVRAWRISQMEENGICSECKAKLKEERREELLQLAKEQAKEHNLPALSGTPKQVEWATQIRAMMIEEIERFQRYADDIAEKHDDFRRWSVEKMEQFIAEMFEKIASTETRSTFYIDNRGYFYYSDANNFIRFYEKLKKKEEAKIEQQKEKEIEPEITVLPENFNHKDLVKIIVEEKAIKVKSVRDETIIETVKNLGFKWNGETWEKAISYRNAPAIDRAAEVANKLLTLGFGILCDREEVREKAVSGDIAPEHKRWVGVHKDQEHLMLFWEKNSDIYDQLRKIPTSSYSNGTIKVNLSAYREIEEMSELLDFKISNLARKKLDEYREQIESIDRQKVSPTTMKKYKDGLSEILQDTDILDDLKEEQ